MTYAENEIMSTDTRTSGVDCDVLADLDRLMRHLTEKTPVDPELAQRVEERADRVIEELRRTHDPIDIDKLLHDTRDEL
jgi:hypothetical protein